MSRLHIQITRKCYPKNATLALEGLRLSVDSGQFVALVGPSGAGKTTLLNIVAGLDTAFEGRVERTGDTAPLAMVFQSPRLMPWLTVIDNVTLVLGKERSAQPRALALLDVLGLDGFADAFPGELSGGMQRRVALARAFAVNPRLLLMDEPFLSLDAPLAWRLRDLLMDMWSRQRPTVLYVTHDLDEALFLADRVVFLSARPARVILEQPVDRPRPRGAHDAGLAHARGELLARHPHLLSGRTGCDTSPGRYAHQLENPAA